MSSAIAANTGLFYAYAKNILDDVTYRYLITFASRDVADTWFRLVTDSAAGGYARFASVQRVTQQFYTHNPAQGNIPDTITDTKVALSLRGQVFFTLINDRDGRIQSIIPVLNYAENLNGSSFYIRSVPQPDTYWYYDTARNLVVASRDRRTRFTITIADKARAAGAVIIGSDDIYVSPTNSSSYIGVTNSQDRLGASVNPFPFRFSSFNGDFQIDLFSEGNNSNLGALVRNPGKGERWELVN